ncbi:MAG: serine/threonine-protein kinase [Planctomycetota bacterium]
MSDEKPPEQRFESICKEFKERWTEADPPDWNFWCEKAGEESRFDLLSLLLVIDIEMRNRSGQRIRAADYSGLGDEALDFVQRQMTLSGISDVSPADNSDRDENVPEQIGPYRLVNKIGEGGMGSVWLAEQSKPVQRRVALKIVRPGFASPQIIARFEAERQALTLMDHPSIARVLDAGETQQGAPYFVMELVDGVPITEYCDQNELTVTQRLELVVDVCRAVQHAHQKGIIHRDIKPTNVLVTTYDGKPVPKVIDFGLAKALEQKTRLSDQTLFTEFGQVVGTLQYMSPEQAGLDSSDIDTRTDVYALGVMLYELLAGSTPIDREELGGNAVLKVLEMIREKEPPRPSDRLSDTGVDVTSAISRKRRITPSRLRNILRGELDWIVMKALEKERDRRYDSPGAFAADIQRYINDEPVAAKPPSTGYRLRKFVKKNRALVGALSTIAALLIAGIFGTTWFALSSRAAEADAVQARNEAVEAQNEAEESANLKDKVLALMIQSFERASPTVDGRDVTLSSILERAVENFKSSGDLTSRERIALLRACARSYHGLGLYKEEVDIDSMIRPMAGNEYGENSIEKLNLDSNYLRANSVLQSNLDELLPLSISIFERRQEHFPEDRNMLVRSLSDVAEVHYRAGRFDQSIEYISQAREMSDDDGVTFETRMSVLMVYAYAVQANGEYDRAVELLLEHRRMLIEAEGPRDLRVLRNASALANAYTFARNLDAAIDVLEETIPVMKEVLTEDHQETLNTMSVLAVAYSQNGRPQDGVDILENIVEQMRNKYEPHNFDRISAEINLAVAYHSLQQFGRVKQIYNNLIPVMKRHLGKDHAVTMRALANLGLAHFMDNELDKGLSFMEEAAHLREQSPAVGPDHPETIDSRFLAAKAYAIKEEYSKSIGMLEDLVERCERAGHDRLQAEVSEFLERVRQEVAASQEDDDSQEDDESQEVDDSQEDDDSQEVDGG